MAYFTGSVTSITALRQVLIDACATAGWAWDATNQVLSKGALFARITTTATDMQLLGRTSTFTGDTPNAVAIGRLCNTVGFPTFDLTWPAEYHLFVFPDPDEVYLVVRYDVDIFQWAGFGQSSVVGLAGTGMWVGATRGDELAKPLGSAAGIAIFSRVFGGSSTTVNRYICPALAWSNNNPGSVNAAQDRNTYIHSNFDGGPWLMAQAISSPCIGVSALSELLATQPSAWSTEAALLPMRAYKIRPSNRVSLTADFMNARHVRIDNLEPGQIIELGPDSWMVFPWLRKNIYSRDGSATQNAGGAINHTGTFGWAIRYEGP